jgi:MiaB-like tRNA modifying enzyme
MPKAIYIQTYGCTLNHADSDIMKGELLSAGFEVTDEEKKAAVIILNTCTVKEATENKLAPLIEKIAKTQKPLVIAGCMNANRKLLRKLAPKAVLLGTGALDKVADAIDHALAQKNTVFDTNTSKEELQRIFTAPILRIPIAEGCVNACHFCHTKLARPKLRSIRPRMIRDWISKGIAKGAKEIQMTAMDSGVYGMDIDTDLIELLNAVSDMEGDFKVRLGMINPQHVKRLGNDLINALKLQRYYKFLHVPVQTGSEKVCTEMNRGHSVEDFYHITRNFKNALPELCFATDIIVGYPTETKDDFEATLDLLENVRIDIVNVSKFSPRPDTKAKALKKLPSQEVKRRSEVANNLVKKISAQINEELVGREYEVLMTEKDKDFKGRNENYKQVVVKNYKGELGQRVMVEITDSNYGSLIGRLV